MIRYVFLLILLLTPVICQAQNRGEQKRTLELSAASEPVPALKHQLLPSFIDQTEGNAAPLYYRAIVIFKQNEKLDDEAWDNVEAWLQSDRDDFPTKEVETFLAQHRDSLFQTELGARRTYCRWEKPIRERAKDIFAILLPELQEMRSLNKILCLRIRLQIIKGEYDQVMKDFQTGYAMSKHINDEPFLVSSLVSIAMASMINQQLEFMASQADAPNMYWAVSALPSPFIDMKKAIDLESSALFMMFPILKEASTEGKSKSHWDAELSNILTQLSMLTGEDSKEFSVGTALGILKLMANLPKAKKGLLNAGFTEQQIKKMPDSQIILLYTGITFEELRDDMFKWWYTEYHLSVELAEETETEFAKKVKQKEIIPFAGLLVPAVNQARKAQLSLDRDLKLIRVTQALRMHMASHDNPFPKKLSEIKQVPIPVDPFTNRPFRYEVKGETAKLQSLTQNERNDVELTLKVGK